MLIVFISCGRRHREAVLRDHGEEAAVQVHRVVHPAQVRHPDPDPLTLLHVDRLGHREFLPVDDEAERSVAEQHDLLAVGLARPAGGFRSSMMNIPYSRCPPASSR
jgi:hypothetical protein